MSPLPATGLESYTYDPNGNPQSKTDARSVTTNYNNYDGLNRPQSKSYTDGTPTVTYKYDQDWRGALSSVSTSVGSSVYSTAYTHDGFGRIKTSTQVTGSGSGYGFTYTYSLADQLNQIQYPSGRTVVYAPDSAGRITSVQNPATSVYYANNIVYTPARGFSSLLLGNGLTEQSSWNDRQQLTGLTSGPAGGTALLGLQFYPCPNEATACSTNNTGSLQGQTISFSGVTLNQNYTYDLVERLSSATETGSWSQTYGYAPVGNRYVSTNSVFPLSPFTPTTSTNFDANNRLQYDSATYDPSGNGNQTSIGGSGGYVYTYDAENRLTGAYRGSVSMPISSTGYVYDGDGQRVQKVTCTPGTNPCTASSSGANLTTYVYDVSGIVEAEYTTAPVTNPNCHTCYITVDHLGSTRMLTDDYGSVLERHDYLPSGEELFADGTLRTTAQGYLAGSSSETVNVLFTGQYRDQETGLDHMGLRYYSPQQARFVTVDPGNAGADATDPRTWNGYAYVGNDPLSFTDPSGECWWCTLLGIGLDIAGIFTGGTSTILGSILTTAGTVATGGSLGGDIFGDIVGSVNNGQPWNEQLPAGVGSIGALNTGTVFGSGNTGPFIFSLEDGDQSGGFWTVEYNGNPYWYVPTSHTTSTGLQMRAAPKPSKLSVAGGCVGASLKDHLLGLGASAGATIATVPLKKPWLGVRDIGGPTNLLSKLGTYFNIRLSSPAAGGGANPQLGTLRAFGAAGRILGPAAWAITGGQVLKAGQDAYSCYSISH